MALSLLNNRIFGSFGYLIYLPKIKGPRYDRGPSELLRMQLKPAEFHYFAPCIHEVFHKFFFTV